MHFLYSVYFLQKKKLLIKKVTSNKILFLRSRYISLFEIVFSVLKAKDVHLKSTLLQYKIESKCVLVDFRILLTDRTWSLGDEDSCEGVVFSRGTLKTPKILWKRNKPENIFQINAWKKEHKGEPRKGEPPKGEPPKEEPPKGEPPKRGTMWGGIGWGETA